jgi:hypothetical protein
MKIQFDRLVLFILAVAVGINFYFDNKAYERDIDASAQLEEWNMALMTRIIQHDAKFDSLKASTQSLAKATIYLDSCQQNKSQKVERAERRGKFVGGLLRGLFPGL